MTNSRVEVIKPSANKFEGLLKLATCATRRFELAKKKTMTIPSNLCTKSLSTLAYRKRDGVSKTTICPKCRVVFEHKTSNRCINCRSTQKDDMPLIPESLSILHCQSCAGYTFSKHFDFEFVCSPLESTDTLRFLLRPVLKSLNEHQLNLIDAYFMPSENDSENKFKVALVLEKKSVDGTKQLSRHIIVYNVVQEACACCSFNINKPVAENTYTVILRRCPLDRGSISRFLVHSQRLSKVAIHRIYKVATNVLHFVFRTENEANIYYNCLCKHLPIRSDKIPGDDAYKNGLVCPIGVDDLVYVRLGSSGRLMICTKDTNPITLLDPESLTETTITADEYWSDPTKYETYKDKWDLVNYVVLDVKVVMEGTEDAVADMTVARVADYGKNDKVYKTRTHLGNKLKPMDRAFGYDLCGANNGYVSMADKESLRDVVLLRVSNIFKTPRRRTGRRTRPLYDKFLQAMEETPETLFHLPLNDNQ